MSEQPDSITRQIDIDAGTEIVWELISEPGWWINDGTIVPHTIETDGDLSTVKDPMHGAFQLRTVALDRPRYAAFRWLDRDAPDRSTLVEFWVEERSGGSTLRVVESGFAALKITDDERASRIKDNAGGWDAELDAARTHLTSA